MTRSLIAFGHGDIVASLMFNPLTLVYLSLAAGSAFLLAKRWSNGLSLRLPEVVGRTWLAVLVLGWVLKFALGTRYW